MSASAIDRAAALRRRWFLRAGMRSFSGAAALLVLGVADVVPDGPAAVAGIRVNV